MTESTECIGFIAWFKAMFPGVLIFHVGNERKCSIATGKRLKDEGIVAGIPDYMIPEMRVFIEMKKPGGKLSPSQKEIIPRIESAGYTVIIGYGAKDASEKILEFTNKNY